MRARAAIARSPVVVAIPGTLSRAHLEENIGAQEFDLTAEDLAELASLQLRRCHLSFERLAGCR